MNYLSIENIETVRHVPTMHENTTAVEIVTRNGVPLTYTLKVNMKTTTFMLTISCRHTLAAEYNDPITVAFYEADDKVLHTWHKLNELADKIEAQSREEALATIRHLLS